MNKTRLLLIFISIVSLSSKSQQLKDDQSRLESGEDLNVLYKNEASFSIYAHSAGGIGIAYRRGYQRNVSRKRMLEIEAQNFKHPKEVKSVNSYYENAKGFYYGKLNSYLLIRPGVGMQNIIYEKSDKKSVEIRYACYIGAVLAFAKPVYLEIKHNPGNSGETPSVERYDPDIHQPENIYGKAPFFTGIEKTTIYPGGYAKLALSFDYASRYNGVKSIETGVVVDVYPTVLPMMAYNKNQQTFVQLYIKLLFGKKWF